MSNMPGMDDQFWIDKLGKAQKEGLTMSERGEIRERYLAEKMVKNEYKLDKRTIIGKEDMMNLPRHKVAYYCSAFQECPLCYKCRSYNSSHEACRKCVLTEEKLHCNTELHSEHVLNIMVKRERIDLDGLDFRIFYHKLEDNLGHINKIVLPGGSVIMFDHHEGKIDFEPMRDYIGHEFEYFVNGESQGMQRLTDINLNKHDVKQIVFEGVDDGKEE